MYMLKFIQKRLIVAIPAAMAGGLVLGYHFNLSALKILILPFTFLMVYPMMVSLGMRQVFLPGHRRLQLVTHGINFIIIPVAGFILGAVFFRDNAAARIGIMLTSLLPTSGMTISWTGFSKGNLTAAVKMTVTGLVLGSVLTPLYLEILMGASVNIELMIIARQIILIVFIPMVLGYLTQRFIVGRYGKEAFQNRIKQNFPPFSTLGVLGIVFVAMAMKSKVIFSAPEILIKCLVPVVIMYFLNFTLSTVIGKYFFRREDAIALVYGSAMRNLSIALAIAMTAFGEMGSDIALIISAAYIIQVQAGAWYARFTDRLFSDDGNELVTDQAD